MIWLIESIPASHTGITPPVSFGVCVKTGRKLQKKIHIHFLTI